MPSRFLRAAVFAFATACAALAHAADGSGLFESLGKLLKPVEASVPAAVVEAPVASTRNLGASSASSSTRRVALVIGNDAYKHVPPLEKAANDARAMGKALEQVHFETRVLVNATRAQMNKAINQFADDVAGGGVGVFFFAGHGVQVNNQNFLIPVDLQDIQREADVADQGVSLQGMQDKLAEVRAKFSLLVIDACRDNPLPKKAGRALGGTRGLSQASSAEGQMVVFSAGANQQALDKLSDNDLHPNGVFTRELLPWLGKPGVSIRDAVLGVRSAVRATAKSVNHEQFPAIYDQAEGNFYFIDGGTQVAQLGPGIGVKSRSREQIEDELWDAIKDGEKASVFEEYIKQYPNGRYLAQARVKIAKLKAEVRLPFAPVAVSPAPTPVAATNSDPETQFWNEVKTSGTREYVEAYLKQYPKGKYIALARVELKKIDDRQQQEAQQADQKAWEQAKASNTATAYAGYLDRYPKGGYAALAQAAQQKLQREEAEKEKREAAQRKQDEERQKLAAEREAVRVAEEQRKAREEAARGPQWAESDNGTDVNWAEATRYCESKGRGWSLPTAIELQASFDLGKLTQCGEYTCKVASISRLTGPWFWSNEQYGTSEAWTFNLYLGRRSSGNVGRRINNRALCVRRL